MNDSSYDIWASRINQAIRNKAGRDMIVQDKKACLPSKDLLLSFAAEAESIVGAIARNIEVVDIQGRGRFDTLDGFLDEMLPFDEFSLLEYRYRFPENQQPGLRFKVAKKSPGHRIIVVYFKDLLFWDVDEQQRRLFEEPALFEIAEGTIIGAPSTGYEAVYRGCASWQEILRETLAIPFRHLFNPTEDPCRRLSCASNSHDLDR
jgi:hypothetical protein